MITYIRRQHGINDVTAKSTNDNHSPPVIPNRLFAANCKVTLTIDDDDDSRNRSSSDDDGLDDLELALQQFLLGQVDRKHSMKPQYSYFDIFK